MNYYCTIIDENYLAKAIVLWQSCIKLNKNSKFIFFCMDELSSKYLDKFSDNQTIVIPHDEFASEALKQVRKTRSTGEYCWTAKPVALEFIFKKFQDVCWAFYLDADAMFFSSLDQYLGDYSAQIILTPHNFSVRFKRYENIVGSYNAGFVGIKNSPIGSDALRFWLSNCLNKCSSKPDSSSYADQKYLNDLSCYEDTKVHFPWLLGINVGPWNIEGYQIAKNKNSMVMIESVPLIFYHFQSLKLNKNRESSFYAGSYELKKDVKDLIYHPYVEALKAAYELIRHDLKNFNCGIFIDQSKNFRLKDIAKFLIRPLRNKMKIEI